MNVIEQPLIIDCHGSAQIGILHKPENHKKIGIIIVPAGGPQYRVGCARQIILWSRFLANKGYPVLRFDYRGFGDSAGEFKGFEDIDEDIDSAINTIKTELADTEEFILWAECNAASAIMMCAWRHPCIKALIMQNPWVRDESTKARTYIKHYYLMRIMQKSFWLKLISFKFNPFKSIAIFLQFLFAYHKPARHKNENVNFDSITNFQERMAEGINRYDGKILLLMSGLSYIGREFDELVSVSKHWQTILNSKDLTRIDFPDADHTFSRSQDRDKLVETAYQWLISKYS